MEGEPLVAIKARSAEIQVRRRPAQAGGGPGVLIVVQGWSAPAALTAVEAGKLAASLEDAATRASQPGSEDGLEGPWTASIDLAEGRRATVGFLGELQEGDRPEVFFSVGTETGAPLTKEIAWMGPEVARQLAAGIRRVAGGT